MWIVDWPLKELQDILEHVDHIYPQMKVWLPEIWIYYARFEYLSPKETMYSPVIFLFSLTTMTTKFVMLSLTKAQTLFIMFSAITFCCF